MNDKILNFPHDLDLIAEGYVVCNLKMYGNAILPTELFESWKEKEIEVLLTYLLKQEVDVIKTEYGYKAELRR